MGAPTRPRSFALLAIGEQPHDLQLIKNAIAQYPVELLAVSDGQEGWQLFQSDRPQLVITDTSTPGVSGIELLRRIVRIDPASEVILTTSSAGTDSAVDAINQGAADYLAKPLNVDRLRRRIAESISEWERRSRTLQLDRQLVDNFQLEGIVGRSPLMLEVFSTIRRVAPHFRTALVTGATGTGKEQVARVLHKRSPSGARQFAVTNCSALPEGLLESELFGYVRGAFTGAIRDRAGLFEYADGGTVFLDEIGDMPLSGQAKLLRVLQNQEIQRLGSPAVRKINVRVIAATNRNLRMMVAEKTFREDLYYRLSMVEINLPPLIARKEDIPLLQRHFLQKFSLEYSKDIKGITRRAQKVFSRYWWPGNVREMENVVGRACMMTEGPAIDAEDLPEYLRSSIRAPDAEMRSSEDVLTMDEVQRRHAVKILKQVGGNKARAAEMLGISRRTLYNILERTEIHGAHDRRLAGT